ncbi:hypothetical protein [Zongyangia hominis]|uniref:Uncharacterized protein n=1 Tax=Zongyangia hominis TaxID=2763677 RepID=A0A926EEW8_9FIRM|nr:hypothetical protein [Zongyangia hominis]MBC8570816.1 hypothetical protein [Zongyangia hominis]
MVKKTVALLMAAILLMLCVLPASAISVEQDMYLLYKSDEKMDENGNRFVDLIFCYVDETGNSVKLTTFNRKEPANSSKPGDIVSADVIFGRSACEAKAFFDGDRGYWVVRLTTTNPTALESIPKFEIQVSASRIVETEKGVKRLKYKFDDIKMTELNKASGITNGQVLYALQNNEGVLEDPECSNVTKEGMKAALGKDITFDFEGYEVGFQNSQIQDAINLFAVKKMITPVSKHYNTDGILATIMFWDTQELASPATITVEMDEFSDHREAYAYVYRYENGRMALYTDKAAYSDDMDEVSFTTDKLGSFIVSSKPLEELPVIDTGDQEGDDEYATPEEKLVSRALEAMDRAFYIYNAYEPTAAV